MALGPYSHDTKLLWCVLLRCYFTASVSPKHGSPPQIYTSDPKVVNGVAILLPYVALFMVMDGWQLIGQVEGLELAVDLRSPL